MEDAFRSVQRQAEARVGATLRDKWRIDRLLGIGGMAAVYAGTHRNGKRGAIKMLHVHLGHDEDARRRFLREGYAANRVGHPGAVSVLDDDIADDGAVFLVMELLEGETLDARAARGREGRMEPAEALEVIDKLLDVLIAAHKQSIVHRDLKPENLFLTIDGSVKVLDFGLARLRELPGSMRGTRTGTQMGTPAFMAKEQALGHWDAVDSRTDLWAVGATLFTVLTGRLVHLAGTVQEMMLAAMTKPARPLASVMPGVHPALALVVDRALAFEQKNRWPDARTMQQAVREARAAIPANTGLLPLAPMAPQPVAGSQIEHSTVPLTARKLASPQGLGVRAVLGFVAGIVTTAGLTTYLLRRAPAPAPAAIASEARAPSDPSAASVAAPAEPSSVAALSSAVPSAASSIDISPGAPASASSETARPAPAPTGAKPARGPRPSPPPKKRDPWNQWQ